MMLGRLLQWPFMARGGDLNAPEKTELRRWEFLWFDDPSGLVMPGKKGPAGEGGAIGRTELGGRFHLPFPPRPVRILDRRDKCADKHCQRETE
jgi:hypothetical protein